MLLQHEYAPPPLLTYTFMIKEEQERLHGPYGSDCNLHQKSKRALPTE